MFYIHHLMATPARTQGKDMEAVHPGFSPEVRKQILQAYLNVGRR
jgi:hypothetical protein